LLTKPEYFNIPHSEVGRTEGNILFFATLVAVCISIGVGYTFDIFGRKLLISISFGMLIILIWSLPYMPSIPMLIVNRAGV
jgi:MFS family permease